MNCHISVILFHRISLSSEKLIYFKNEVKFFWFLSFYHLERCSPDLQILQILLSLIEIKSLGLISCNQVIIFLFTLDDDGGNQ